VHFAPGARGGTAHRVGEIWGLMRWGRDSGGDLPTHWGIPTKA